ncbi:MAG: phosphoribosyl-AMP cyclohydrolase [Chloroflexi bacterium]|nr:phosphoribosyl-AMP cyclohydrolase [Chloroflexota bacterium]
MPALKFDDKGLIAAIVQDADTGDVLMLGYMNEAALRRTLSGEDVWFYSRSRQELWHKGGTSGNYLKVRELWFDCDADAILVKAHPLGPTCHTGNKSCFFRPLTSA